ncbi:MAG TPA: hypothetical protein VHE33_10380 [Acidobacteriaceae bacterium]|nr:hypothetical protein [Acidobacteriaceae bacterium]
MSCQILVKTAPHMQGHYSFLCEDPVARQEFANRADVFWYAFPEDDEIVWRKGGAWDAAEPVPSPVAYGGRFEYEDAEDLRRAHLKPVSEEDDEDDDRWLPVRRQAV